MELANHMQNVDQSSGTRAKFDRRMASLRTRRPTAPLAAHSE